MDSDSGSGDARDSFRSRAELCSHGADSSLASDRYGIEWVWGPKRFGNDETRANNLSVTGRMPAKMPPTLVFHGTADKTVKFENSQAFTDKMKANGNLCELIAFPDAPHSPNSIKEGEKKKIVKAKIEEESLKFLEKLGLLSPEQASAGAKSTNKEDGE